MWRWPELRDIPPSRRLRVAALVTGWMVIGACVPGLFLVWRLPIATGYRVMTIAAVSGAAVYVALEIVFRRMAEGLDVRPRRPQIESVFSREFTFLLNNWVLCSLLFFILVATTFPLISEALTGEKVTVGPPFYKAWVQPLGITLLILMGVGTLFGWKKTGPDALKRAFPRSPHRLRRGRRAPPRRGRSPGFSRDRLERADLPGRDGGRAPRIQCVHASSRIQPVRLQRRRDRAGVRLARPVASKERSHALDAGAALVARRASWPRLHSVFIAAPVAPAIWRIRRPPRDFAHVRRIHRAIVEHGP